MPELPDVAVFQQYIDATSLHQKIESVEVADEQVLEDVTAQRLSQALAGRSFMSTFRYGKHLFVELSEDRGWLEMHFGMTGEVKYYMHTDERPRYARTIFHFDNGFQLAYVSRRKLGHITLVADPGKLVDRLQLGPDALRDARDLDVFRDALAGGRGTVKAALMTQEKLAGIGNVYSDEILFHAHLHPESQVAQLDDKRLKTLHRNMMKVLETAIERKVDPGQMPRTWLLPHRDDERCPRCGDELTTIKVSGRTSRVCERCQERLGT